MDMEDTHTTTQTQEPDHIFESEQEEDEDNSSLEESLSHEILNSEDEAEKRDPSFNPNLIKQVEPVSAPKPRSKSEVNKSHPFLK
jgi:hypothetical protein